MGLKLHHKGYLKTILVQSDSITQFFQSYNLLYIIIWKLFSGKSIEWVHFPIFAWIHGCSPSIHLSSILESL